MASAINNSAIFVRNAYKHYGPKSGPKCKQVLEGLCMTVQRGSIYGLLGASGCGKTTLLSCIVGRKLLDSGELWVLGGTPGSVGSGVPGPRIGYMPQEIALVPEFSVRGVVNYFGRIVGMTPDEIESRWHELRTLLDLPPDDRRVCECSGGQQRRVSLAAALVHGPELLILDEPTVGLDPVLREKIWTYMVDITIKNNVAVIITTHYIEECRQAHRIGLMRQGRLMAEESPSQLIARFSTDSLEEVFLNLSIRQNQGMLPTDIEMGSIQTLTSGSVTDISLNETTLSTDVLTTKSNPNKKEKVSSLSINGDRLNALIYKNFYQFFRNYSGIAFMIFFPLLHITTFFLAIGGDPVGLPVAFVNDENGTCQNFDINKTVTFVNETDCEFDLLSCRYLLEVNDPMIDKIYYNDLETAMIDAQKGVVTGVVYLPANYTRTTIERIQDGRFASDAALEMSEIKVWLDMSNRQIGPPIQVKLLKKYVDFTKRILNDCGRDEKIGDIPIRYNDPIFGSNDISFNVFMVPGLIVTVIYFLAAMMTSAVIISDRSEGIWDRTLVAGATAAEIMAAHMIMQFVMIIIQTMEVSLVAFVFFKTEYRGTIANIFGLVLTQGVAGMCYGFMISAFCTSLMMANFVATGSFYPMLLICGILWPIEAMPKFLKFIAILMPFTIPVEALRSAITRGWDITYSVIWQSYGITTIWTVIYLLLTFYFLKKNM